MYRYNSTINIYIYKDIIMLLYSLLYNRVYLHHLTIDLISLNGFILLNLVII